jgi:SpoVK/Ycf46/Vps4 family AAA+-type ATPase
MDFTYGRSLSEIKKLKNDFNVEIENLIRVLNGNKYESLKKIVNANWVGNDAIDFLEDVEKTRTTLEKNLRTLKNKFNDAIEADLRQFEEFQDDNVK